MAQVSSLILAILLSTATYLQIVLCTDRTSAGLFQKTKTLTYDTNSQSGKTRHEADYMSIPHWCKLVYLYDKRWNSLLAVRQDIEQYFHHTCPHWHTQNLVCTPHYWSWKYILLCNMGLGWDCVKTMKTMQPKVKQMLPCSQLCSVLTNTTINSSSQKSYLQILPGLSLHFSPSPESALKQQLSLHWSW